MNQVHATLAIFKSIVRMDRSQVNVSMTEACGAGLTGELKPKSDALTGNRRTVKAPHSQQSMNPQH